MRRCWLHVPLLLSSVANGAPSPESRQEHKPPVFESAVTLVAVPVFVTDKSGKAVAGLTPEDFEVHDGGQRVAIVAFQAVDVDVPVAAESELPAAVRAAVSRQFLLLFDLQFSPPAGITRARTAAMRFVRESLSSSDLVAVGTFGRGGLTMLTNFTSDRPFVARAIEGLGLVEGLNAASDPLGLSGEFEASAGGESSLADEELAAQAGVLRDVLKRGYQHRVVDFLATLEGLAQTLSSLRGRKQIVLLSAGFAQEAWTEASLAASPMDVFAARGADPQHQAVRNRMSDVFRRARESDVVIHSVSLGGLEGAGDVSSPTGESVGRSEGIGSLAALAENTGGRFVLPTNDFGRALREMDQVSRRYYVLAFQPAGPVAKPGRPRSLKVRVRGAGLSVSHRGSYVMPAPPSGSDPVAMRLAAAEAIGKGLSGGPLRLHLAAMAYRDLEGKLSVPAVLHIDGTVLAAAARDEKLSIQVYGYAMKEGHVLDTLALDTTLDVSKHGASLRSEGLRLLTAFAVSPGAIELRFFVHAGPSGETGAIRQQVEMPPPGEGQLLLSAPLLTLPPTGRIAVPMDTRNGAQLEIPFRLGSERFIPDSSSALEPGRARELCVFLWPARTGSTDPLAVTGELAQPGQKPLPLSVKSVQVVPDADGYDRYVVTIVPPPAPPGAYTLRLTLQDAGTGLAARTETEIVLTN